uniref:NIDO domain-containing protein n=1 Tax=Astyanax mexicanus TaxID=7994 RepID=A0A8B9L406_ASTMX
MDGVIMFESVWLDDYIPNLNVDAIAPLWSDIDTYSRGLIQYEQATNGPLLRQASHEINRAFPGSNFNASWVFVGTWLKVEFEPDTGVTFQVVLIADDEGHSFVLMNYGPLPADQQPWMAGYQTKDNTHQYIIQTASTSDLTTSTNVGIPGRWAFSVNGTICSEFTVILLRDSEYFFLPVIIFPPHKDIIAPLWTDIDTHTRGDISYTLATNGTLLKQASDEINRMFPGTRFTASWVFVATWEKMEFEPDTGVGVYHNHLVAESRFDLSKTSNVGIPGRWAFRVDGNLERCL